MARIDTAGEIRIGRDWKRSIALAVLCPCLVAVFLYGVQFEAEGYHDNRFQSASYLLLPVFLALSGVVIYRLFVPPGALVRLGPDGFVDWRAGREPVPWSEVRNVARRGQYVSLTLRLGYARRYPFTLTQRLLKATRRSAGPSHLLVVDWCLATGQTELLEQIAAYRQAHANG